MKKKRLKLANPLKVLGYIRVSTVKQATSGLGLEAQRDAIEAYCRMKGLELVEILFDSVESARKIPLDRRPAGSELCSRLNAREVGGVVSAKLDRLFRNTVDTLTTVEHWDSLGVGLHVIDFGGNTFNTSTAIGRVFITFISGMARFEADLISERTVAAMAVKKKNNQRVGSIPFGKSLGVDGKNLVTNDSEVLTINLIRDCRYIKGLSVPKIRNWLNTNDRLNRGKPWHLTSLYRLLKR